MRASAERAGNGWSNSSAGGGEVRLQPADEPNKRAVRFSDDRLHKAQRCREKKSVVSAQYQAGRECVCVRERERERKKGRTKEKRKNKKKSKEREKGEQNEKE